MALQLGREIRVLWDKRGRTVVYYPNKSAYLRVNARYPFRIVERRDGSFVVYYGV